MFKYNLKFSIRNLFREPISTLVKVSGLGLGFLVFLIVLLYVQFERSYDQYFTNYPEVVRLGFEMKNDGQPTWNGSFLPVPLMYSILDKCPEIKSATRLYLDDREASFYRGTQYFETQNSYFTDSTFFKLFNVDLVQGNRETVLKEPNTAAISKSTAVKMFGNENPIGKSIKYQNRTPLQITGVFEDFPVNSSFNFDILISFTTPNFIHSGNENNWDLVFVRVFLLLQPETNQIDLAQRISQIATDNKPNTQKDAKWRVYLENIDRVHLATNVTIGKESKVSDKTLNLLLFIAIFILIIALINHLNLSATQVVKRIRQIGIEKVSGQRKVHLIAKSLIESSVVFIIALLVSIVILLILVPLVNTVLGTAIGWETANWKFLLKVFGVVLAGTSITTLFELSLISRINLTSALKGKMYTYIANKQSRKWLMSFQFLVSLVLIFVTLVFYAQTDFMFKRDLGMSKNNLIIVKGRTLESWGNTSYTGKKNLFKEKLRLHASITDVSSSNIIPGQFAFTDGVASVLDPDKNFVNNVIIQTDEDYINTYDIKMLAGNNFSTGNENNTRKAIITATSAKALGFENAEDAIGQKIIREYLKTDYEIVGVTEDFMINNLLRDILPITMYFEPFENRFYSIRYEAGNQKEVIAILNKTWKEVFNQDVCRYSFLSSSYKLVYRDQFLQVKIYSACSFIAVLIACIGLFGLAYASILQKRKEIGVRKVNGARVSNIFQLIYKEYLQLILIAALPGLVIAYIISLKWLENFYYKIQVGSLFFIAPVLVLALVTFITISYHAFRAATKNPVESLRYE